MTVGELIEELMKYPENMPICIESNYAIGSLQYVGKDKYDYLLVLGTEEA